MKIGVIGTGAVGRTLAGAIAAEGHEVVMGTRDVATLDSRGGEVAAWRAAHPTVSAGTFAQAAAHGEMIFNATPGMVSAEALAAAGADNLAGKILVDVANPLDFSGGMPPSLSVVNTDSLAEQLQRAFPSTRVVKALNTVNAALMVAPRSLAGGRHDLFICGDDADAKSAVAAALREWFGWQSVVDLGDLTAARATEMYLPLWIRLMSSLGTPTFNVRIVRAD